MRNNFVYSLERLLDENGWLMTLWALLWILPGMFFLFGFSVIVAIVNFDVEEGVDVYKNNL